MNKVEVKILNESNCIPSVMTRFLAALTQRGHKIADMHDLTDLYRKMHVSYKPDIKSLVKLPHGSIKRHTPITVAIVGASRRFLAQIRTHKIGIEFVSASLQYSDYSNAADFYVPYEYFNKPELEGEYLAQCKNALQKYEWIIKQGVSNDSAAYLMPQGLRNILIATANHEAWSNTIRTRVCNRNTDETQYVVAKIWETLISQATDGAEMFHYAGPDCLYGRCKEGHMSCGKSCNRDVLESINPATTLIKERWPLLYEDNN